MENKKVPVNLTLTADLISALKEHAEKMSTSYSTIVRMACIEYLERHTKKRK